MHYAITLHRRASASSGLHRRLIGRVVFPGANDVRRQDSLLRVRSVDQPLGDGDADGYAALLVEEGARSLVPSDCSSPVLSGFADLSEVTAGTVMAVSPDGSTHTLFRPESRNNAIFATARCNHNCLMCPQPPAEDEGDPVAEHLRLISLIESAPENLCITGGEPTLLGEDLTQLLSAIRDRLPKTAVIMLTNGRRYADYGFVSKITAAASKDFVSAIPVYADVPDLHDWIVQSKGAFAETVGGLYNAARHRLRIEIRVVLHRQTVPRLLPLMDFIHRSFPFASHVALMGLENMGYVRKNWDLLWIDPLDYADVLAAAVRKLHYRQMHVSVYNLPLCVLPKSVWPFARHSISDFKNIYLEKCNTCSAINWCCGLFSSSHTRHSRGIRPI